MANRLLQILIDAKDRTAAAFRSSEQNAKGFGSVLDGVNKALGVFGLALGAKEVLTLPAPLMRRAGPSRTLAGH